MPNRVAAEDASAGWFLLKIIAVAFLGDGSDFIAINPSWCLHIIAGFCFLFHGGSH